MLVLSVQMAFRQAVTNGDCRSSISEFFKGRSVFITGATGFVGKALLEKLLRSCTDIENVYILIREKKGKSVESRIQQLCNSSIFEKLRKTMPNFHKKIIGIEGNITCSNLGIKDDDLKDITNTVSVVYHAAATVKFNEPLEIAVLFNVKGTKHLIQFAKQCTKLEALVHFSTAYSHYPQVTILEEFYPPPCEPYKLIDLIEKQSSTEIEKITPELLGKWPNTYTFTKAVAEELIKIEAQDLPVCIVRPSIVIGMHKDPTPGWTDSYGGVYSFSASIGSGLWHIALMNGEKVGDLIPVDLVVNLSIVASYKRATEKKSHQITIYNSVSSAENPLTWGSYIQSHSFFREIPSMKCASYPFVILFKNRYVFICLSLLVHLPMAIVMDICRLMSRHKPKYVKTYKFLLSLMYLTSHFTLREWVFTNNNVRQIWNGLSISEKHIFPFDVTEIDWRIFLRDHLLGIRQYLLKDDISTLPKARSRLTRLAVYNGIIVTIIFLIVLLIIYIILRKCFIL